MGRGAIEGLNICCDWMNEMQLEVEAEFSNQQYCSRRYLSLDLTDKVVIVLYFSYFQQISGKDHNQQCVSPSVNTFIALCVALSSKFIGSYKRH